MSEPRAIDVAFRFVEHINRRELESLVELMTPDHRFIDLAGDVEEGRDVMGAGWADYFAHYPDYMIHISHFFVRDDVVIFVGRTTGSHLRLPRDVEFQEPVIWIAPIENGLVAEWRLYPYTDQVCQKLGIRLSEEG